MYDPEKERIIEASRDIISSSLTVGSWGNISMRTHDGNIVITPSGKNYKKLSKEDLIVTDINGNIISGKYKPSSERLMHYEIYKKRKDVNAIVHTHAVYSSVLSVIDEDLPVITEDVAMLLGHVRVAKYAITGSMDLALNVASVLNDANAAIMANHGAVAVGVDMERAYTAAQVLEKSCKIFVLSRIIGRVNVVPEEDAKQLSKISESYLSQWKNWD
ncbi:class II aldolase/adducin family protein [Picrophilus oshimae]|uniref:L-fuculose-phosphate aldolase n=1 Tax=Picrophilus torridus (strain ATCC 700027 / DSM 9790 / JCM 10055 / NBRC 100828 / KAW 2/3) TaxID=1122961 RepID=A0A8G2FWW3_PICTO|nr:class II aldolase/adducin family protein [Picrophilus oshimae]SMD30995.1 L-fuculose-phosphate aldolase [Picrophilus oshimae DSM 9789]